MIIDEYDNLGDKQRTIELMAALCTTERLLLAAINLPRRGPMTWTALPITSAARPSPLGPLGIVLSQTDVGGR